MLSTRSTRRIEDVAAVAGPWWFQVYMMRERSHTARLVQRAAAAGASALVLTVDTPVVGRKRRDSDDLVIPDEDAFVNLGQVDDLGETDQAADLTLADIGWLAEVSGGLPVVVKGVLRPDDAAACAAAGAAGVLVPTTAAASSTGRSRPPWPCRASRPPSPRSDPRRAGLRGRGHPLGRGRAGGAGAGRTGGAARPAGAVGAGLRRRRTGWRSC